MPRWYTSCLCSGTFLSHLFTHLDVYLTFIPDIHPHWVRNDVAALVVVVTYQTEGWHQIRRYQQDISDWEADWERALFYQDSTAQDLQDRHLRPSSLNRSKYGSFQNMPHHVVYKALRWGVDAVVIYGEMVPHRVELVSVTQVKVAAAGRLCTFKDFPQLNSICWHLVKPVLASNWVWGWGKAPYHPVLHSPPLWFRLHWGC